MSTLGEPDVTGGPPVSLVAGVLCLAAVASAIVHARHTDDPFLDPRLFRDRVFRAAALVSLLTGYALAPISDGWGSAVWVDRVRYAGPSEQRVVLGSLALAMAVGAIGSGYLLKGIRVVPLGVAGLVIATTGMVMLGTATQQTQLPVLLAALGLFGLGFGITVTPRSTAALESLGRASFGIASAGVTVSRMAGMAIGLAVLTGFGTQRIEGLSVVLADRRRPRPGAAGRAAGSQPGRPAGRRRPGIVGFRAGVVHPRGPVPGRGWSAGGRHLAHLAHARCAADAGTCHHRVR